MAKFKIGRQLLTHPIDTVDNEITDQFFIDIESDSAAMELDWIRRAIFY